MSEMQRTCVQVLSADVRGKCEDTDVGIHVCRVQHGNGIDDTGLERRIITPTYIRMYARMVL